VLAILAIAVLDSASGTDDPSSREDVDSPSVFIDIPDSTEVLVRGASFEIGGGFGGSVTSI